MALLKTNLARLLEVVSEYEGIGVTHVAEETGLPRGTVGTHLNKLATAGHIHYRWIAVNGKWAAVYYYGKGENEPKPDVAPEGNDYWGKMPPPARNALTIAKRFFEPGNPFATMIGQLTYGH